MIRHFEVKDLIEFRPNKHSHPGDIKFVFADERYEKYTYLNDGVVKAFMLLYDNGDREWGGFFLMADDFTARDGVHLKRFVVYKIKEYNARRVWTVSDKGDSKLDRWHEFLGFEKEGVMDVNGKLGNLWGMVWDSKHLH